MPVACKKNTCDLRASTQLNFPNSSTLQPPSPNRLICPFFSVVRQAATLTYAPRGNTRFTFWQKLILALAKIARPWNIIVTLRWSCHAINHRLSRAPGPTPRHIDAPARRKALLPNRIIPAKRTLSIFQTESTPPAPSPGANDDSTLALRQCHFSPRAAPWVNTRIVGSICALAVG